MGAGAGDWDARGEQVIVCQMVYFGKSLLFFVCMLVFGFMGMESSAGCLLAASRFSVLWHILFVWIGYSRGHASRY